ncbi:MAG TPA: hypothetical protein VGM29_13745 [Polyangiaceae bacterium]
MGLLVFGLLVSGATAIWTYQVLYQVFSTTPSPVGIECRPKMVELARAVVRARAAAAADGGGERAALTRFRAALEPEWNQRKALDGVCNADPTTRAALADVDALRYAEEHAVRYEALGLGPERLRVQSLMRAQR